MYEIKNLIKTRSTHEVRTQAVNHNRNPITLTFDLSTQNHYLVKYPKVIPYTKFERFGTIRYHLFLNYAADKRTNRQTDSKILSTLTDKVDVGNKRKTKKVAAAATLER